MVCWCIVRGCSTNVEKKGLISYHNNKSDGNNYKWKTYDRGTGGGTSTSAPTIMLRVSDNQSIRKFTVTAGNTKSKLPSTYSNPSAAIMPTNDNNAMIHKRATVIATTATSTSSEIVPDDHHNPPKYKHVAYIRCVDSKLMLKNDESAADCSNNIRKFEQDPLSTVVTYNNNKQRSISCQTDAKEYSQLLRIKKAIGKTAQLKNMYRHRLFMANKKIAEMKKIITDTNLNGSLRGDTGSYDDDDDDGLNHWTDEIVGL